MSKLTRVIIIVNREKERKLKKKGMNHLPNRYYNSICLSPSSVFFLATFSTSKRKNNLEKLENLISFVTYAKHFALIQVAMYPLNF